MRVFEIYIHTISRRALFLEVFQKNRRHCENGLLPDERFEILVLVQAYEVTKGNKICIKIQRGEE